jgi:hypothetical protein
MCPEQTVGLIDESFFDKMLSGRASLMLIAWRRCYKELNNSDHIDEDKFQQMYNDFLTNEYLRLRRGGKITEMFRDFEVHQDDFDKLQKEMNNFT